MIADAIAERISRERALISEEQIVSVSEAGRESTVGGRADSERGIRELQFPDTPSDISLFAAGTKCGLHGRKLPVLVPAKKRM
jgi:hypothetical protein